MHEITTMPQQRKLAQRVAALLTDMAADGELEALHPHFADHSARLGEALRVAVIGEVNAGKSTLVNALVGQDVAQTSGGEQTYVNWWFRHGTSERMRLRRPDGVTADVEIGAPLGDLDLTHHAPIEVFIDSTLLEGLTVIDTPGLYSLRRDNSEQTRRLVAQGAEQSVRGAREADALLYLTASELPGSRDQDTLSRFTSTFGAVRVAPTNALMLLSRAERRAERDRRRDPRPPLEQVATLAATYREELFSCVWNIAPVSALAAALARTERIDDEIAGEVGALAAATAAQPGEQEPSRPRRRMLAGQEYLERELAARDLPRLSGLCVDGLGVYEMGVMLEVADAGGATPAVLTEAMERASGLADVEALLRQTFADRGDIIQADAALSEIETLSYRLRDGLTRRAAMHVRARCEEIRMDSPELQDLADARAVVDPSMRFELDEQSELAELFGGGGTPVTAADAQRRAAVWMARANATQTTPQQRGIAMRAHRRYAEIIKREDELE